MATVTQQIANVRTKFHRDPNAEAISDQTILLYLNQVQDWIETEVILPAMQDSAYIDLVDGTREYSVDSDLFKLVLVRYNTNDWVLKEEPFLTLQKRFAESTGTPQEYYVWGNKIGFYPEPDANETGTDTTGIKYWYFRTLRELVESGAGAGQVTTSEVPENFHWVLEAGAGMLMAQEVQDEAKESRFQDMYLKGIERLKARYMSKTDNYDSEIQPIDELDNRSNWRFNPYQS